jgi:hypothetical protein
MTAFFNRRSSTKHFLLPFLVGGGIILGLIFISAPYFFKARYALPTTGVVSEAAAQVRHIKPPPVVKGLYMTSWVAGTPRLRQEVVDLIDQTEINALVIDIKDYTGKIAFQIDHPLIKEIGSAEGRISDIEAFIDLLHKKGVYVIGRIAVFQDPHFVKVRPKLAVRRESDGGVWKDRKGISWLDAGSLEVWQYTVAIAEESYKKGFDELNFDYIRFPSDGNMNDIRYPVSEDREKRQVIEDFFAYISNRLRRAQIPISADLFGMTTTNTDDLNIGQVLESALPYFDYIAPMVYPSHYPPSFIGFANPAEKPYEVIKYSMDSAVERVKLFDATVASTSIQKLRPWLQDFDLGATYTADMVRKQIQAVYDSGLSSWTIWSPSNKYTAEALLTESR